MPFWILLLIEGICLTWCLGLGIYVLFKRRKNIKKAEKELQEYNESKKEFERK